MHRYGAGGLAAPQIGVPVKIVAIHFPQKYFEDIPNRVHRKSTFVRYRLPWGPIFFHLV